MMTDAFEILDRYMAQNYLRIYQQLLSRSSIQAAA
jgi:hypothetical protein